MKVIVAAMAVLVTVIGAAAELRAQTPQPAQPAQAQAPADPARALFLAGRNFWDDGRFADAEKKFREALAKYPTSENADRTGFYLIETLIKMGRTPEALAEMNKFFTSFPRSKWLDDVQERRIGLTGQTPPLGPNPFGNARPGAWGPGTPMWNQFFSGQNANAVEQELLRALLKSEPERGLDVVKDRLKADPSDPVALSNFSTIVESSSNTALPLLIAVARTSSSVKARAYAAFWLGRAHADKNNTVVKALAEIVKDDSDDSVRITAAQSLSTRKEPEAIKALEDLLRRSGSKR
jgi:tetratricopeptide (TPR) repeat protein